MNIKNLRKNYKTLSLIERHSLFISAAMRNDESELTAIENASPKMLREMPDFTHLYQKVLSLLMIVLIYKADAYANWLFFSRVETEKGDEHSRLALYFFFVYADAWAAVCEQMKIDADALVEKMFPDCFLFQRIALIDKTYREYAFSETEAREFINMFAGKEIEAKMTLENKIAEFRKFIGLPKK